MESGNQQNQANNIYQNIKSDSSRTKTIETSGIFETKCIDKVNNGGYYISINEKKINQIKKISLW